MNEGTQRQETFQVTGDNLLKRVREILREGNVRRVIIKDRNDKVLLEFPLTVGVVGAALSPVLAAIGAIAALVNECTITVVREA